MRNSVATAPRSIVPPVSGSGVLVFGFAGRGPRRRKNQIDGFLNFVLDRLQRHHASLPDRGVDLTGDMNSGALPCQIEYACEAR